MNDRPIDLRVWRQFVAVAEELHFGRAAIRLHMTQPPLTQAVAQLEAALGTVLFDRSSRRVQLSPAGRALLPEARDLLARAAALPARARAAADGEIGRLRLAFVSTAGFELLPAWVRGFRAECPQVALELVEATGDVQLQALALGEIDAGIVLHVPGTPPPGVRRLGVGVEPLVLALPDTHPLAGETQLPLDALLVEPLLVFPRRILPSLHDAIFGLYAAAGRIPHVVQEAIQMQTIVNLVAAGMGIAWVPETVAQFRRAGVAYRAMPDPPRIRLGKAAPGAPIVCETSLVWRADQLPAPALARFIAHVERGGSATPAGPAQSGGPSLSDAIE